MHYTEYVVNMQKHFLNNHTPLSRMQLERGDPTQTPKPIA